MAKRKKSVTRRGAHHKASGAAGAWLWLLGGILIGLGGAVFLAFKGYLPELKQRLPSVEESAAETSGSGLADTPVSDSKEPKKPRYDFFTVLPEMEVVVPKTELSRQAGPLSDGTNGNSLHSYILQVGSFRSAADAEQMKARLALLGSAATVQTVTVNDKTWHRVRIGPFEGARKTDEMRRMLDENQIDTLVMKANP